MLKRGANYVSNAWETTAPSRRQPAFLATCMLDLLWLPRADSDDDVAMGNASTQPRLRHRLPVHDRVDALVGLPSDLS